MKTIRRTDFWKAVTAKVNYATRKKYRFEFVREVKLGTRTAPRIAELVSQAYTETRKELSNAGIKIINASGLNNDGRY